jgi:DNA-binding beta-propeller fold protein YncE
LGTGKYAYEVSGENWGKLPEGWFYKEATSVDVDSKDNVYVFNRGNHPMIVFDPEGNVLRSWGEGGLFTNPHAVTVAPDDTVWCVDNRDHSIRRFTPDGRLLMTLNERNRHAPAMSGEPFCSPTRVAVDPRNGEILVADGYGNARVHRFSPDGKRVLKSWGRPGTEPGRFNIVHDIAVDEDGLIYIGDRENRRIQVFNPEGKLEARWPDFSRTAAVCVSQGLVYVGEYYAGGTEAYKVAGQLGPRISILDGQGRLLARLGEDPFGDEPGRFYAPHGVAADSRGNIYVAEVSHAEFGRTLDPPRELRSMQKLVKKG